MGPRGWLLVTMVALVGVLAAVAFPSDGSALLDTVPIVLTPTGPSPSSLTLRPGQVLHFVNRDSVTHTVAFSDGRCSLTVDPGEPSVIASGVNVCPGTPLFPYYVGTYAYSVDGKFHGTVDVIAAVRRVSLTARTHTIQRGHQVSLHGRVIWGGDVAGGPVSRAPFPVIIVARYDRSHPLKRIATFVVRRSEYGYLWHLHVRPRARTTYLAEAKAQPPEGQVWEQAQSGPFTIQIQP